MVWVSLNRFSIENTRSAMAENGCTKKTFCAAVDQYGRSVQLFFHHSRVPMGSVPHVDEATAAVWQSKWVAPPSNGLDLEKEMGCVQSINVSCFWLNLNKLVGLNSLAALNAATG